MDYSKFTLRFKQFGGFRLVWQYAKQGVLPMVVKDFVRCVIKRQSFKAIYPGVLERIEPFLVERFPVSRFKIQVNELSHEHPKVIWWCWLQGIEVAPLIVRVCYNSLRQYLTDYEIKVIDNKNWKEYVVLPNYVVEKWEKGRIPAANFSDLLRLELLIKYGGTWIDSTVLCTGFDTQKTQIAQKYLDADLFLFQYTPEGTIDGISISNWFISAHSNNVVLMAVRDMLMAYWKDYNCTLDYYMFHLFFEMVAREYPEQVGAMPYGCSQKSIALMCHWNEPFRQEQWDRLVSKVAFHKLSHRVSEEVKNNNDNYYNYILNHELHE